MADRKFNPRTRKIQEDICCLNKECEMYGKSGSVVIVNEKKRQRNSVIYECLCCLKRFSERKGTPLFGLRKSNDTIVKALQVLAERGSIRSTARVMGITKDTMCSWLRKAAQQCETVNKYLVKDLNFDQVQLDEMWTFVKKKTSYRLSGNVRK